MMKKINSVIAGFAFMALANGHSPKSLVDQPIWGSRVPTNSPYGYKKLDLTPSQKKKRKKSKQARKERRNQR